jgi:hypothetical protein
MYILGMLSMFIPGEWKDGRKESLQADEAWRFKSSVMVRTVVKYETVMTRRSVPDDFNL